MWGRNARQNRKRKQPSIDILDLAKNHVGQLKLQKATQLSQIKQRIMELEDRKAKLSQVCQARQKMLLEKQIQELQQKQVRLKRNSIMANFHSQMKPLLTHQNGCTKVMAQNVIRPEADQRIMLDEHRCPHCDTRLFMKVKLEESMATCPNTECGASIHVDVNIHDLNNAIQPISTAAYAIKTHKPQQNHQDRQPNYRDFLMPFHVDASPPPEFVVNTVYRELETRVHVRHTAKIQNTAIQSILRNHGLTKYSPYITIIGKMLRGEFIPRFTSELIDRLVARFELERSELSDNNSKKRKTVTFNSITNRNLKMEGYPKEAAAFPYHKGPDVSVQEDKRLKTCYENIRARPDNDMEWSFHRSK